MYTYHVEQWLLFFYFYCFCGWLWECAYVSIKNWKWCNRGFMHGPLLPIYGSGAIVVLLTTLPVRDCYPLVFLFGMVGATVLEYFTGVTMEKLFHMRYWDYSNQPFNLKGHICLGCSIGWGFFSVALLALLHPPVERLILMIPSQVATFAAFVITVLAAIDFTQSFNEAMDLRDLLERATESNEKLRHLEKRVDVVAAVVDDELRQMKEKGRKRLQEIEDYVHNPKLAAKTIRNRQIKGGVGILKRNPNAISEEFAEALREVKQILENKKKPSEEE